MRTIRASILALATIACASATAPQQQKPVPQPTQAQLQQQIDDLKKRLDDAELRAKSAALDTDYITRVQKQYESYYKEVLATQTNSLWVTGIFVTVILALAGRIGLSVFERLTKTALSEAAAQLRSDYAKALDTELRTLKDTNAANIKQLSDALAREIADLGQSLKDRSDFQFRFAQGLASAADKRYPASMETFQKALASYKSCKPRNLIEQKAGAMTIRNIFVTIRKNHEENYLAKAKEEIASTRYDELEEELADAAEMVPWLGPLIKERGQTPTPSKPSTPTQPDTQATNSHPPTEPTETPTQN